jgi:hypothetical protein
MTSLSPTYYEDLYTLQGMTKEYNFSEQLIREIQMYGYMLPEIVKFGSAEIEIYSTLDRNMCNRIEKALEKHGSLSQAIAAAQAHVVQVYRVARGEEPVHMNDSPDSGHLSGLQRKKLCVINELLQAVGISEEQFHETRQHIQFVPLKLLIPGKAIEYYAEDDYLRLQYIVTLVGQGCPLEEAARVAYDWGMHELW